MKRVKSKLAALTAVPLLALSSPSFAAKPAQPDEAQLSAAEPMQLNMAEMDKVTAAGYFNFAPTFNIVVFYNYGILQIGNIQGHGGTSNLLGAAILKDVLRF